PRPHVDGLDRSEPTEPIPEEIDADSRVRDSDIATPEPGFQLTLGEVVVEIGEVAADERVREKRRKLRPRILSDRRHRNLALGLPGGLFGGLRGRLRRLSRILSGTPVGRRSALLQGFLVSWRLLREQWCGEATSEQGERQQRSTRPDTARVADSGCFHCPQEYRWHAPHAPGFVTAGRNGLLLHLVREPLETPFEAAC